jgi:hypothetical protein
MRTRAEESPPRQEDRDRQPSNGRRDALRNSETPIGEAGANHDARRAAGESIDQEDINTHGSER